MRLRERISRKPKGHRDTKERETKRTRREEIRGKPKSRHGTELNQGRNFLLEKEWAGIRLPGGARKEQKTDDREKQP